jgi:hypothetical protein
MVTRFAEEAGDIPVIEAGSFFKVYPNPTSDKFNLELNKDLRDVKTVVQIFNMVGGSIMKEEVTGSDRYEFDLGGKIPGIYFIQVMAGDRVETKKITRK